MLTVAPTNIAPPQNVTTFIPDRINIVVSTETDAIVGLNLSCVAGNMSTDATPVFEQVGDPLPLNVNADQCAILIAANPALFAQLKTLIDQLIGQAYNLTGTVS